MKKPSPLHKSSSDGVQNSIQQLQLNRSSSDSRVSSGKRVIDSAKESWMKFKDDVDSALQKKPNQAGFYKNLADMMHNKMEMLNKCYQFPLKDQPNVKLYFFVLARKIYHSELIVKS